MTQRVRHSIHRIGPAYALPCTIATSRQAGAGPGAQAGRLRLLRQTSEARP